MATFTYNGASWTYNEVTAADGRVWMDRNLGATQAATSSTDTASYGDLFQWGRLDDGHQVPTSGTTTTLSSTDIPGNALFIKTGFTSPYDWRSPKNDNLWQNGLNVPAPTGWHVPTQTEWATLVAAEGITGYATAYSSNLKLTAVVMRNFSTGSTGTYGNYWSSTVNGADAYGLYLLFSSVVTNYSIHRAGGNSVRLIKDLATPSPTMTGVQSVTGVGTITF